MKRLIVVLSVLLVWNAQAALGQDLPLDLPDRVPAQVMSYRGADWLERPERVAEELPEQMLAALGLENGDVVVDLGAGSGFYTRRMARLVAPTGTVYGVDIQPEMIEILRENIAEEGITNVVPVLSVPNDPGLPEGAIDWVLLVDVYHELSDAPTMLAQLQTALKADGRVALVEYRVEDGTGDHILAAHRMSVRQVMNEWTAAGFRLAELHEFLPTQHLFILEKVPAGSGPSTAIRHVDLLEAMADGTVTVTARGDGPESMSLTIQRRRPERMVVTFGVGTFFSASDGKSDMVALRDGMVLLTDADPKSWTVPARRAYASRPVPSSADQLAVQPANQHRPERNVMWVFQGIDLPPDVAPRLEQVALWIASDDAGYDVLADYFDGAPIAAGYGVALAVAYVDAAGIDVTGRRIWSERARFVPSLTDAGLRAFFENR